MVEEQLSGDEGEGRSRKCRLFHSTNVGHVVRPEVVNHTPGKDVVVVGVRDRGCPDAAKGTNFGFAELVNHGFFSHRPIRVVYLEVFYVGIRCGIAADGE